MKMKLNMALLFWLAAILTGCTDKDIALPEADAVGGDKVEVCLNVLLPLADLPSTRAIADDSQIDDYTVWVFEDNNFVEAVNKTDTYHDAQGVERDRIVYDGSNGGTMTIALDSTFTAVRLMMIANCSVTAPAVGTTWADAEVSLQGQTFDYDGTQDYMPMYGTTGEPFAVTQGAEGVISLRRCMAKVVVDITEAVDHFTLDSIYVYHVNPSGTVAPTETIVNSSPLTVRISGQVSGNIGTVYIPEISGIKDNLQSDGTTTTFVIIKGQYTNNSDETSTKYYRLDFIRHTTTSEGNVSYEAIDTIKRNHAYIFDVRYLVESVGQRSLSEARDNRAANVIREGTTVTVKITDENIMDITTDNYIYLGVTAGHIDAVLNTDGNYYAANIHVVTNNPAGWEMNDLPANVKANPDRFEPTGSDVAVVQSVWVYFPVSSSYPPGDYHSGQEVVIYIYSSNIRKSIVIKMP